MTLEGEKRSRWRLVVIAAIAVAAFVAFQKFAPDIDVEQLLEDLSRELGDWTYALVGVLAFLETGAFVGLVFPGETAVILGGAVAGQGETSIVITIAIVWFCAWARRHDELLHRHAGSGASSCSATGRRCGSPTSASSRSRGTSARHGGKTILIGRFIGLVRALAPFIAGSSGMLYRAFVPYSILGTGLWAAAFSLLGYVLAHSIDRPRRSPARARSCSGSSSRLIVAAVVISRYLREPENRAQAGRSGSSRRPACGGCSPQLRFAWRRVTPGGLGLEFTSLLAALAVVALRAGRLRADRHRRRRADAGRLAGDRRRRQAPHRVAHRRGEGGHRARHEPWCSYR